MIDEFKFILKQECPYVGQQYAHITEFDKASSLLV